MVDTAGSVDVRISADLAPFQRDLRRAQQMARDYNGRLERSLDVDTGRSTRSLRDMGVALGRVGGSARDAADDVSSIGIAAETAATRSVSRFDTLTAGIGRMRGIAIAASGALAGIGAAAGIQSVARINAQFEATERTLRAVFGSQERANEEFGFVSGISNRLGTDLQSSIDAYASLAAAAQGTNAEGEASREIFEAVSQAMAVLGRSAADTEGALRAVEQMVSKGKVTAEELRGQLGERLPGAFRLAAQAMGVTTAQLDEMLVKGDAVADSRFLLAFADQIRSALPVEGQVEGITASVNRLNTEVALFARAIGQAGANDAFSSSLDEVADAIRRMNDAGVPEILGQQIAGFVTTTAGGVRVLSDALIGLSGVISELPEPPGWLFGLPRMMGAAGLDLAENVLDGVGLGDEFRRSVEESRRQTEEFTDELREGLGLPRRNPEPLTPDPAFEAQQERIRELEGDMDRLNAELERIQNWEPGQAGISLETIERAARGVRMEIERVRDELSQLRDGMNDLSGGSASLGLGGGLMGPGGADLLALPRGTRVNDVVEMTNAGATRDDPITPSLARKIAVAVAAVYGPGFRAQVYSGGQGPPGSGDARVGTTRHDFGRAADVYIVDPQGNRLTGDPLGRLAQFWLARNMGGVGLEMRGGGVHLDEHTDRAPTWSYGRMTAGQRAGVQAGLAGQLPPMSGLIGLVDASALRGAMGSDLLMPRGAGEPITGGASTGTFGVTGTPAPGTPVPQPADRSVGGPLDAYDRADALAAERQAIEAVNEVLAMRRRHLSAVQTEEQAFIAQKQALQAALQRGAITQDEYNRALEVYRERMNAARSASSGLQGQIPQLSEEMQGAQQAAQAFGNALIGTLFSIVEDSENAEQALKRLAMQLAQMVLQGALLGQGPLGRMFGGGLLNGLLGGGGGAAAGLPGLAPASAVPAVFASTGGLIRGEGTGTSDSIPAMLSDGEYVVRAAAVERYRPLLDAINQGRGPQGYAAGGPVGDIAKVAQSGIVMPAERIEQTINMPRIPETMQAPNAPRMAPGGGTRVVINDQRKAGSPDIRQERSMGADGMEELRLTIRDEVEQIMGEDFAGGGPISRGFETTFGGRRRVR